MYIQRVPLRVGRCPEQKEQGAVLIHVAIAMLALLAFTTLAVDYGVFWVSRAEAQNAADAGAHAGAVALAFDDAVDRSTSGKAYQAALVTANANQVWQVAPAVTVDVVSPCPDDGSPNCVRVDVFRNQAKGNPLPVFFGNLLGLSTQGVRATATARYQIGDATDCLKPFAMPDRWVEHYPVDAPWNANLTFDTKDATGNPLPNTGLSGGADVYIPPSPGITGTSFQMPADIVTQVILIEAPTLNSLTPGPSPAWSGRLDLGGTYQSNFSGCNGTVFKIGDTLPIQGGKAIGQEKSGFAGMSDSGAYWNTATKSVAGSCAPGCAPWSPRIGVVAGFDVQKYDTDRSAGVPFSTFTVTIANLYGVFVESVGVSKSTTLIYGRLMPYEGQIVGTGGGFSFLRIVNFVR